MDNKIIIKYYKSPVGELILGSYNEQLCLCDWRYRKMRKQIDIRIQTQLNTSYIEGDSLIIKKTIEQLAEYFVGERKEFNITTLLLGSIFQKQVWELLQQIPYGQTRSYLELSDALGNKKAIRAVAAANGANAISIIIPCHRIIGSDGKLIGYAGGLDIKRKLLDLEKTNSGLGVQTRLEL
jgi:methylated-DNA-[protein]-cysteine S-methyltransferase